MSGHISLSRRRSCLSLRLALAFAPVLLAPSIALAQSEAPALATPRTVPQNVDASFAPYLEGLRGKARSMGISDTTMDAVFPTLTPNPRVIALDRNQPGGPLESATPPFAPYRRSHVTGRRIAVGKSLKGTHDGQLASIEAQHGVAPTLVLAIFGHESDYGRYAGNFDILRSLATLAHEGRRRDLFESEFLAALKILQMGVPRSQLVGSWAGAMGFPQFMPSVYLRVARDGNGDGKADIWNNQADTLASITAYFKDAGWRRGQTWGVAVSLPEPFDRSSIASSLRPKRCARVFGRHSRWLSMAEWKQRGLVLIDSKPVADTTLATLLEPDGPGQTAYLLTSNYRAILDYNCSNLYALSAGLLADAIDQ